MSKIDKFALALYCGLKAGEILNLKYDSFNLRAGTVTVNGMHIRNYSTNEHYESKAGQEKYSNRKLRGESNSRASSFAEKPALLPYSMVQLKGFTVLVKCLQVPFFPEIREFLFGFALLDFSFPYPCW